jgi:Tol biopolymer transport system component
VIPKQALVSILFLCACAGTPIQEEWQAKETHLANIRQLTTVGVRSGESYFSPDGEKIVYMAIRDGYPFFRIFEMNADGTDQHLVGPERGKQTCPYYSPDGKKLIFGSTHLDPDLGTKEKEALEAMKKPPTGPRKKYKWDFDETYEIFEKDLATGEMKQLTNAPGYDAECAYSPDGTRIVFTSCRDGNPEIYTMGADGSDPKRITEAEGYDGGPFFSPDGKSIIFRGDRDKPDYLQVFIIGTDGTGERKMTDNDFVNWGPYYHPSGEFFLYATSRHGHRNYEIYLMRTDGSGEERITYYEGFDGLPSFSQDGKRVIWTSRRGDDKHSQVFIADWKD